jgi:hypothetical protein
MSRLTDTVRAALGYWWDLVNGAAQQGFTVTETVAMANNIATDLGQNLTFRENTAISELYGYARRIINAGNTFTNAAPSQGITSDMISVPPWARDVQEMATSPTYNVKFTYTYLDQAGNEQTATKTSVFPNGLPGTVGELTSQVLDDAEAMANKYGHTLLSATPFSIQAV